MLPVALSTWKVTVPCPLLSVRYSAPGVVLPLNVNPLLNVAPPMVTSLPFNVKAPPTNKSPAIPTPPYTCRSPVPVLVEFTPPANIKLPNVAPAQPPCVE